MHNDDLDKQLEHLPKELRSFGRAERVNGDEQDEEWSHSGCPSTDDGIRRTALDALFVEARTETPADTGAAGRFLAGHRQRQRHARHVRAGWLSVLTACAAAIAGFAVLKPLPDAPASTAYQVYAESLGEGW
ncbi:hypothetical protein [Deinococcus fonticola]|uniref:hypothetical protein n=1 Tax=Deinococcus fonticola TaxID=2528713 RepID=UPI001F0D0E90|nr:hypothetical protein [Deinococcus fonticola]